MPLSKLIVQMYGVILEVGLWFLLLGALVGGWQANGFIGAITTLIGVAILASVVFGAFLVLNEIRDRVKAIELRQSNSG